MNDKKNRLTEIIASAVEETFEEMVFLEACHVKAPAVPLDEGNLLRASLLVHDPFPGEICLVAPRPLVTGMARALFRSEDECIPDETLLDLQAELLNSIAGKVMNQMTPEENTFKLGLPETEVESLMGSDGQSVECHFDVGGEMFSVAASGDALIARGELC
jgi:hypothetical protein